MNVRDNTKLKDLMHLLDIQQLNYHAMSCRELPDKIWLTAAWPVWLAWWWCPDLNRTP